MIGEVVLALQAVNALASAVSDSAGHASTLGGIVGKLTKTNEAIQTAVLQDMDKIMSESRIQHEKDMAALKRKRAENRKLLGEIGQIFGIFTTLGAAALAAVWAWFKFK